MRKAQAEKTLVFYSGGPAAPYERMARDFEQRYPGITVSVTGGFSNVLDRKIDDQLAAKKLDVDMAIFQTVQDFVAWKKAGVLLPFKPDGYDKIDPRFRDKDGAFTTTSVVLLTYAYNTKLVAPADVPKSALDFLKPQFAGKLVTAYPADDDATLYVFDTIVKKYGWDYMKKYMAQKPNFIQGHLEVLRSVANGTDARDFRFDQFDDRRAQEIRPADRLRVPGARRHADLFHHRRHLQGRAASERRQALPRLVHGEESSRAGSGPTRRAPTSIRPPA